MHLPDFMRAGKTPNVISSIAWILCLLTTISPSYGYFCPSGCSCFQRVVRCIRARLTAIPRIPQDTTVVDLRFNHFPVIPKKAFIGLSQLTTIFLNDNDIVRVEDGAFDNIPHLRFLYMNNNRLTNLPENTFEGTPLLEAVYLENNEIRQIDANTFSNLPSLSRISIFNNKLTNIPLGSFTRLPSLKRLRLDGNPIDCDCAIYTLWKHHLSHPQRNQISITLMCETPRELNRLGFSNLQEKNFRCKKPEILQAPHDMRIKLGDNIELPCRMVGDPEPEIVWMQNTNEILAQQPSYTTHMEILSTGSLKINTVDANDVGIYECIGRNSVGETKSQPIRMMVMDNEAHHNNGRNDGPTGWNVQTDGNDVELPPQFIHRPSDTIAALNGPSIVLDCAAIGEPAPEIQWFFNGRPIQQSTEALRIHSNGSLAISQPIPSTAAGLYRCEATNHLGSIDANARIDVKEMPEILVAPQNQIANVGRSFVLECDADGNPVPSISWQLNGTTIVANERVALENENTELIVSAARESDTGIYSCVAENENGRTAAEAFVTVERINRAPELSISPFDLEAFTGTTIELPCKSQETEGTQITWRHDGRIIDPNVGLVERYQISGAGSLFVKNVTIRDSGRYECSLKNEFGRATASAVVTIKNTVDLAPGDRYVRIAFEEAAREIDLAINNTVEYLFNNRTEAEAAAAAGATSSPQRSTKNFADLLRVFRFPTGEARQLARAAEIYERTLVNIRKHVLMGHNLSVESDKYEFRDLLSRDHLHLVAELSGCMEHREMPNCTDMCYHSKYRSVDGTCNNLRHPTWGASLIAFRRIEKPIYENGFSMPIGWMKGKLYAGYPKPSARLVSTTLISTKEITPDDTITHMVMQWGQFLDHDLDHAIPSVSSESWDGIDCKKTCEFAPPCYPVEVPPNDPRIKNRRCIDIVRSSSICGSGMTSVFFDSVQHREQINQLTSYIDASQVYGYSYEFSQELRNLTTDEGLLRVGVHFPRQKDMLPFAAPQDGMDCRRNLDENTMNCFVAGDIRVNEQVGLLAMHTIWMREHNRIAVRLRDINPHWDGDTLYQEARKIVGAEMQHISFKHWLPLIVGESGMRMLGEYRGYDPNVNPSIANEFATAALRFGHTIINPVLHRLDSNFEPIPQGHLQLHKAFFAPWRIAYEGGVDPLMRGMFAVAAKLKTPDQNLNTELTEKLFLTAHAVALDLAAMNVQRGRDHGIPGYNVYRRFCNLSVAETFDDLRAEIGDPDVRRKLKELYGHPDNIDVWVGGVLEDQVDGGKVGPLFQCLLVEQFRRLRDGDRFYYENPTVFMPEQLAQIKQANLGRVLCDNGDNIEEITDNVFLLPRIQGGYKKCEDIPGVNLYFWQDCGTCNSMPPLLTTYVPETYIKSKRRTRRAAAKDQAQTTQTSEGDLDMPSESENDIDIMFDINEERISGLEDVVSSFQKELKKMHKKLRKLEESSSHGCVAEQAKEKPKIENKPKRSHCVDRNGTTRLNNEIWSPDVCTKCECRHGQVTCTHEICGEIVCANNIAPVKSGDVCCPFCPQNEAVK